ncbi:MAG: CaiB/BaiF CoA-transferase family protein [Nocardioidaceae bacterium]
MAITLGQGTGPLRGVQVVELAGIGPGPHAATILADLGADVIRVQRPGGGGLTVGDPRLDYLNRGRPNVAVDLKSPDGVETVLRLVEQADVLIEGMRPGVTERLGLGPDDCLARNPRLVYGRMTGWGQTGPWASMAGHDLNYIAITGALDASGQDPAVPSFPQNLLGDFGGGSTYLVIGLLAVLTQARTSGQGQVVDAAIVDGVAHLNLMWASHAQQGIAVEERGKNMLDGGLPNYSIYQTADGKHVSVAPLEPQFLAELFSILGLDPALAQDSDKLRAELTAIFATKTRAEWAEVFEGTDACVVPILPLSEALEHPQIKEREVFVEHHGMVQPAPAPRFSRTPATLGAPPALPGEHTREALLAWGITDVDALLASGAVVQG